MTASSPMVTPLRMVLPPPIHTRLPMVMGSGIKAPAIRSAASSEWFAEYMLTCGPSSVWSPIVICPQSRSVQPKLMYTSLPMVMFLPNSHVKSGSIQTRSPTFLKSFRMISCRRSVSSSSVRLNLRLNSLNSFFAATLLLNKSASKSS